MDTERNWPPNTLAYRSEREKLPEELLDTFDQLVEMYRYYATLHHSHPFVSYKILADLVREGWRLSSEPISKA